MRTLRVLCSMAFLVFSAFACEDFNGRSGLSANNADAALEVCSIAIGDKTYEGSSKEECDKIKAVQASILNSGEVKSNSNTCSYLVEGVIITGDNKELCEQLKADYGAKDDKVEKDSAAQSSGDPVSGSPKIVLKNIMILKTRFEMDGQTWTFTLGQIDIIKKAFEKTFPEAVFIATRGDMKLENTVVVDNEPLRDWDKEYEGVFSYNVPGWEKHLGGKGLYDLVFLMSPRRQKALYAGGELVWDKSIGWVSLPPPNYDDVGLWSDTTAGWTHEMLHNIGEAFYKKTLKMDRIPEVHGGEEAFYLRAMNDSNLGPLDNWWKWYKDYLNKEILIDKVPHGLGAEAWKKGNIRDYYRSTLAP